MENEPGISLSARHPSLTPVDASELADSGPVVEIITLSGRIKRWRIGTPDQAYRTGLEVRTAAACANNLAMVHGARAVRVVGPAPSTQVDAELSSRYPQVRQLAGRLSEFRNNTFIRYSCRRWSASPPRLPHLAALGVNVGQSYIKGVATAADRSTVVRVLMPTWDNSRRSGTLLRRRTLEAVRRLRTGAPDTVAIGLAVGGIVFDSHIHRGSGITLGLSEPDAAIVTGLGAAIEAESGLPVLTAQDARSKAYYAAAQQLARNALVLDLGTSLGGAYIDANGCIPALLNQVGRVACDLSDDAVPRVDGQGRGLLSQYVSAAGARRLSRTLGVEVPGSSNPQEWSHSDDPRVATFVRRFRHRLELGVSLLSSYYDVDTVVITGGLLVGRFGDQVLAPAGGDGFVLTSGRSVPVTRSPESMYDAALGVAWAAANEVAHHAETAAVPDSG
jgi:predicted NBD/HSP70 family sugar kinase